MRENKILENVTVLNKVDNRKYLITSVTDGVGEAYLLENSHWEEFLDFHIRLAALIASWGDYTKDNFKNFSKDKIEEELFNMERKNYDIAIVKQIMNKE